MKRSCFTKRHRQILIKIGIMILAAFFCAWLLEYRARINDAGATFEFISTSPQVYLYSVLIMFFILLFFYGILRRPFLTIGVAVAGIFIIGYINIAKFSFRGMPLLPEDFTLGDQAGTLTKFVDTWEIVRLILAVILTLVLAILLDKLTKKYLLRESAAKNNIWWKRYATISRIAIVAVALSGFLISTNFIRHHTEEPEQEVAFLNTKFTAWSQAINYDDNGFLIGFLYNCNVTDLTEPDGYTRERMASIVEELRAKQQSDIYPTLSRINPNIIIVLNESFYDPEIIRGYYPYDGGDVTPNLHKLQQELPHGTMYSVDYGGGTANIEYEVLTGLTNYFLNTIPYTNHLPKKNSVPSLASFAKENGYATIALHPFNGGMYKREKVLPILGFEQFITESDFSHTEKDGESQYINDRSAYKEVLDKLDGTEKSAFVSLITMQNHAPYEENEYGEPKFRLMANVDVSDHERYMVETYLMSLNISDKYLGEFVGALANFPEDTVMLFFGDHSPGVFPIVAEGKDQSVSGLARQTPYLIYANFELPGTNTGIDAGADITSTTHATGASANLELPTTTPNCLGNTLLNLLHVQKPAVNYLLDTICTENPILDTFYFGENAPFSSTELSEYELMTYDLVAGKQWSLE